MRYLAHVLRFELINNLMEFGSTINPQIFFLISTTSQNHTTFILVTVERGDGVAVHDFRTEVYVSASE